VVQPQIVVGDAHLVEGDFLGILEETIRPPDVVQPLDVQNSVFLAHVLRQPEPRVSPALGQEDVSDVRLGQIVQNIRLHRPQMTEEFLDIRGKFRPRQTRQLPRAVDLKGRLLSCQSH